MSRPRRGGWGPALALAIAGTSAFLGCSAEPQGSSPEEDSEVQITATPILNVGANPYEPNDTFMNDYSTPCLVGDVTFVATGQGDVDQFTWGEDDATEVAPPGSGANVLDGLVCVEGDDEPLVAWQGEGLITVATRAGDVISSFDAPDHDLLALSGDGHAAFVQSGRSILMVDIEAQAVEQILTVPRPRPEYGFDQVRERGGLLVALSYDGVDVWDTGTGNHLRRWRCGICNKGDISIQGGRVVIGYIRHQQKQVSVREIYPGTDVVTLTLPEGSKPFFQGIFVGGDGQYVVATSGSRELIYWGDPTTPEIVPLDGLFPTYLQSNADPDSPYIAMMTESDRDANYFRFRLTVPPDRAGVLPPG